MDIATLENMDKSEFFPLTTVKQEDDGETNCTETSEQDTVSNGTPVTRDANELVNPVCDSADKQVFKLNKKALLVHRLNVTIHTFTYFTLLFCISSNNNQCFKFRMAYYVGMNCLFSRRHLYSLCGIHCSKTDFSYL